MVNQYVDLQKLIQSLKRQGFRIVDDNYDAVVGNGRIISFNGTTSELIRILKGIQNTLP